MTTPVPTIAPLPEAPSRANPDNFAAKGDAFFDALQNSFRPQLVSTINALNQLATNLTQLTTRADQNADAAALAAQSAADSVTQISQLLASLPAGAINDSVASTTNAWSASKISNELFDKASKTHSHAISDVTDLEAILEEKEPTITVLPVNKGGTGATTLTNNGVLIGKGTGAVTAVAPSTSGNVLTSNGVSWVSQAPPATLTGKTVADETEYGVNSYAASGSVSIGYSVGSASSTAVGNVLVGRNIAISVTTGASNSALGQRSLFSVTSGSWNTAVGNSAGGNTTTGRYNTFLGTSTGNGNTTNNFSTYIGYSAGSIGVAGYSVAIGTNALQSCALASGLNVAIGDESLRWCTSSNNVGVGTYTLGSATSASYNTAIGVYAGYAVTTGSSNVFIGKHAGYVSQPTTTGSANTFVGYQAGGNSSSMQNSTSLGSLALCTANDQVTLGGSSISALRCQVTTITALSDERDKTNIKDIPAGLNFLEAVRPVEYDWNMRDGGKVGVHDFGFIAQELQKAQKDTGIIVPNLVYDVDEDRLEAGYGALLPIMVKAIQELSEKVKQLEAKCGGL